MNVINNPTLMDATNLLEMYHASTLEIMQILSPGQRTKMTNDRLEEIEKCSKALSDMWRCPVGRKSKFTRKK